MDNQVALRSIQSLCNAGNPVIVAPESYAFSGGVSFMASQGISLGKSPSATFVNESHPILGERGGKIQKVVSDHQTVIDPLFFIWSSAVLADGERVELERCAREVPYVGRECDLSSVTVSCEDTVQVIDRIPTSDYSVYEQTARGRIRLRGSTPGLLGWLEDRYESLYAQGAYQPCPVDHRVRVVGYAKTFSRPTALSMQVIPFTRPVTLDEAVRRCRFVSTGSDGYVFPLPRSGHPSLDGKAVGLGICSVQGVELSEKFSRDWIGPNTGIKSLQSQYWSRSARRWMSVIPFVGHPNKWVAAKQIETLLPSAVVTGLSKTRLRPSQASLHTDDVHQAWHVTLETDEPSDGPLVLQKEASTAVFLPDYGSRSHG